MLERNGIVICPLGQMADAGFGGGVRTQGFQIIRLALQRWQHAIAVERRRPGHVAARKLLLGGLAGQRGDEHGFLRRGVEERLHLHQRLVDDEARRADTERHIVLRHVELLPHGSDKGLHARQIGLRVGVGVDAVLAVEEVWDLLIGAGQLAEHIGRARRVAAVVECRKTLVGHGEDELHGVVVGGFDAAQPIAADLVQLGEPPLGILLVLLIGGDRCVGEPGFQRCQIAVVEPKPGGELRRALHHLLRERGKQRIEPGGGEVRRHRRRRLCPRPPGREEDGERCGGQQMAAGRHEGGTPECVLKRFCKVQPAGRKRVRPFSHAVFV